MINTDKFKPCSIVKTVVYIETKNVQTKGHEWVVCI